MNQKQYHSLEELPLMMNIADVKFYSARLELDENLETKLPGFFAAGDGAGVTRGLAQAGASGVQAARAISERLK